MIKGIFFDIDDTIFDFNKCSVIALNKTCEYYHVSFNDTILNDYRKIDDILWKKQKLGIYTIDEVLKLRSDYMMEIMDIQNYDKTFKEVYFEELGKTIELVDNIEVVLNEFKSKGYRLYCASNGFYDMQMYRLNKAHLLHYFDELFVSDKVGYEKPNINFFETCLNETKLRKDEVLMIGDSYLADIEGAHHAGWKTCYFNRKNQINRLNVIEFKEMKELLDKEKLWKLENY